MIKKNSSIFYTQFKKGNLLDLSNGVTHDLLIDSNSNKYRSDNKTATRSNLCMFFQCPDGVYHRLKGTTFLAGTHYFLTTEIETFQINI